MHFEGYMLRLTYEIVYEPLDTVDIDSITCESYGTVGDTPRTQKQGTGSLHTCALSVTSTSLASRMYIRTIWVGRSALRIHPQFIFQFLHPQKPSYRFQYHLCPSKRPGQELRQTNTFITSVHNCKCTHREGKATYIEARCRHQPRHLPMRSSPTRYVRCDCLERQDRARSISKPFPLTRRKQK